MSMLPKDADYIEQAYAESRPCADMELLNRIDHRRTVLAGAALGEYIQEVMDARARGQATRRAQILGVYDD